MKPTETIWRLCSKKQYGDYDVIWYRKNLQEWQLSVLSEKDNPDRRNLYIKSEGLKIFTIALFNFFLYLESNVTKLPIKWFYPDDPPGTLPTDKVEITFAD